MVFLQEKSQQSTHFWDKVSCNIYTKFLQKIEDLYKKYAGLYTSYPILL